MNDSEGQLFVGVAHSELFLASGSTRQGHYLLYFLTLSSTLTLTDGGVLGHRD